jgi:FlaA1/EpsC-like NDP-sugar epimerase
LSRQLVKEISNLSPQKVVVFSRDEDKQYTMRQDLADEKISKRLSFVIGDIRDYERFYSATKDMDIIFHAAALKQVPTVELYPYEAVKTNILGTYNIVRAAVARKVKNVISISTDKAAKPVNAMGMRKALQEKIILSDDLQKDGTKFSCVRYGNVLGSRGSILPIFVEQIVSGKKITITDPNMTRFNITMDQALDLIFRVIKNAVGGDVHIPKLNAYKVGDIKDVLLDLMNSKIEEERIPVRIGEKHHEILINEHEIRNTYENKDDDYVIYENQLTKDRSDPLLLLFLLYLMNIP